MSESMVRPNEDFGRDHGLIHEAVVTGRKVGAGQEFWAKLAHSKSLFRKVVELVDQNDLKPATNQKPVREVKKFVLDKTGRLIPSKNLQAAVCASDKNFYLVQPKLKNVADYADRLIRFQKAFKPGPIMSVAEFEGKSRELIAEIGENKDLANLLKGVYLPIVLPKLKNFSDYGQTLEQIFLPAVKLAYEKQFPGRKFVNHRENDLAKKVSIIPESRHNELVAKMEKGIVVALYFPNPLSGFSVLAAREQMAFLPKGLMLAGGFDAMTAQTMYPDILARDFHTPGYDLSALSWQSPDYSLYLVALDGEVHFARRGGLGGAFGSYSSGWLFFGSAAA